MIITILLLPLGHIFFINPALGSYASTYSIGNPESTFLVTRLRKRRMMQSKLLPEVVIKHNLTV
jgi:hypothetical protein